VQNMPTPEDIGTANDAISDLIVRTPVFAAAALSARAERDVLIKAELFQRGGSFKLRGVLNRVRSMTPDERRRGVATVSAGNHAKAVAIVCAEEGIPATVFMPSTASTVKVEAARAAGAKVDLNSANSTEAFAHLAAFVEETGAFVLHPFDDPAVIAGQGTVGLELIEQCPQATTIVVPVGGGGLISGIAIAVKAKAPRTRIVGVEPALAATLTAALEAGGPAEVAHVPTLADALAPPAVGAHTYRICAKLVDEVITLTEDELVEGLRVSYTECKLACEVGGAAAVAALCAGKVTRDGPLALVVSGGNIAREQLRDLL